MQPQIRCAEEHDLPAILAILNNEIEHSTLVYDDRLRTIEDQERWFKSKQELGFPVLVLENQAELIGYASYGPFRPFDGYRFTVEHSLYIHRDHRGQGNGKLLLRELIQLAKVQGFHVMVAGVDSSNEGSIRFHQMLGFEEVGRMKEVGFKFGRWLDLVLLQLKLQAD